MRRHSRLSAFLANLPERYAPANSAVCTGLHASKKVPVRVYLSDESGRVRLFAHVCETRARIQVARLCIEDLPAKIHYFARLCCKWAKTFVACNL